MRSLVDRVRRSAQDGVLAPAAAAFDFVAKPAERREFGGPLNDQAFRRLIVEGVISACGVRAVIETGSHRGTTTEFFAACGVASVWTVESVPRFYWYTVLRLFYPALESRFESGRRRGCAVLSNVPAHVEQLEHLPALLRPADVR